MTTTQDERVALALKRLKTLDYFDKAFLTIRIGDETVSTELVRSKFEGKEFESGLKYKVTLIGEDVETQSGNWRLVFPYLTCGIEENGNLHFIYLKVVVIENQPKITKSRSSPKEVYGYIGSSTPNPQLEIVVSNAKEITDNKIIFKGNLKLPWVNGLEIEIELVFPKLPVKEEENVGGES